jgi:hypothetical protein
MQDNNQIEKTQAARPYNSDPYTVPLPPPPPPDWYMHQRTGRAWKVFIPVVLLLGGLMLGILGYPAISAMYNHSLAASPTPFVPFALPPTPTALTATMVPTAAMTYNAEGIVQDLLNAGLQTADLQYGSPACGSNFTGMQSSACWRDPTLCNLQCGEDGAWLGVFDTPQDAQRNYAQQLQATGPNPIPVISGYCVIDGLNIQGTYAKIIAYDCQ